MATVQSAAMGGYGVAAVSTTVQAAGFVGVARAVLGSQGGEGGDDMNGLDSDSSDDGSSDDNRYQNEEQKHLGTVTLRFS